MTSWQPIATAPKDAAVLVALVRDDRVWRASDAKFNGLGWYTLSGESCHWATHWFWMPSVLRDDQCPECEGRGYVDGGDGCVATTCEACHGRGVR